MIVQAYSFTSAPIAKALVDSHGRGVSVQVILDLKMPHMSGFDVLVWLALHPELKYLPAVVLSSSADESDIKKARNLGAREYFVKPHRFDSLIAMAHQMQARWLALTTLNTPAS